MENERKNVSRKKFLFWGFGISSLLAVPAFLRSPKKKKKETRTVKMLTQDGRLVEVEVDNLPAKKKKINDADIHTWVNKKTSAL
jgi:hypothetical protein